MGVAEVARGCNFSKTTAHRLLQSLVDRGYVTKSGEPSRYCLNLKLWTLANIGFRQYDLRDLARPHLIELCRATREATHLSMLQDDNVVFIDKVDADQAIQAFTPIGGTGPAHALATGKAMLAHLDEASLDATLGHLTAFTERTITGRAELKLHLRSVREQGYAVATDEWFRNIAGVAAAILDARGYPLAAIGLAGPRDRLTDSEIQRIGPIVGAAAKKISKLLGG
jgi:DNA-binding IclR family transcriptional regulator